MFPLWLHHSVFVIVGLFFYCHVNYKGTQHDALLCFRPTSFSLKLFLLPSVEPKVRPRLIVSHRGLWQSGPEHQVRPIIRSESYTGVVL